MKKENISKIWNGFLYVLGGLFILVYLFTNNHSMTYRVVAILFGLSLFKIIYDKVGESFKVDKQLLRKLRIIIPIVLYFIMVVLSPSVSNKGTENNNNNSNKPNTEIEEKKQKEDNGEKQENKDTLQAITDEKLKSNFKKACEEIKMDVSKIKKLEKKDDWNSGPRYTFTYEGETFILYALDNGSVSSITIANVFLDKIYLDGYESVDVNQFLFDSSTKISLQVKAEEQIKKYIKYPSTAKFNWTGYNYGRRYNIYQISGSFKAKNALDVEIENKFTIEFENTNGSYEVVYLNVDNKKYIGSGSHIKEISRKDLKENTNTSDNSFVLKEGTLGTYGKKDKFDGDYYIRYYIPAGTYKVEALTKNAKFYIETVKLHKEDGYDTATTIKTISLSNSGDTTTFTIKKDQCISLVVYTQIKLTKIK